MKIIKAKELLNIPLRNFPLHITYVGLINGIKLMK